MRTGEHNRNRGSWESSEREPNHQKRGSGTAEEEVLHTLTFLEHSTDREAEHQVLKGKSPGAKSPTLPTHLWLSEGYPWEEAGAHHLEPYVHHKGAEVMLSFGQHTEGVHNVMFCMLQQLNSQVYGGGGEASEGQGLPHPGSYD